MAEENTVTMTVENVDHLFSEIVVNGESHVSENYEPQEQETAIIPQITPQDSDPASPITEPTASQGEDIHAVSINDVLHDFVDPQTVQNLSQETLARQNADTLLQQGINGLTGQVNNLSNSVSTIQSKIPNQASAQNQLADKNFVNSSIATNTANFLGTYTTLQEIEAIPNPTNNDYAYWDTTDSAGNTVYKRYKYNGETDEWLYEYDLNNSSFTAEQWATINSGLTQQSVDEDIQEAISQVGSGIEVYPTEQALEQDLPNKDDGALVATYGDGGNEAQDAPLGSVMPYLGNTDPSDGKWLVCDGRDTTGTAIELETHYPSLYTFLGGTNVLPDLREVTLVGAGENTTDSIANHDVYTLGQFKDDQIQNITGDVGKISSSYASFASGAFYRASGSETYSTSGSSGSNGLVKFDASLVTRAGTTTHGKQKGVNYIIKAVSAVDYYHAPSSEIEQIEQYFDDGLSTTETRINTKIAQTESYSETETLTGGTWIDGKPIYRKVVDCGALPNNTQKTVAHNISNIGFVTKLEGYSTDGNEWLPLPASYYSNSAIGLSISKTDVYLRPYTNRTTYTSTYVIVEYTKTTD